MKTFALAFAALPATALAHGVHLTAEAGHSHIGEIALLGLVAVLLVRAAVR